MACVVCGSWSIGAECGKHARRGRMKESARQLGERCWCGHARSAHRPSRTVKTGRARCNACRCRKFERRT